MDIFQKLMAKGKKPLPDPKVPEDVEKTDDPKYCHFHHITSDNQMFRFVFERGTSSKPKDIRESFLEQHHHKDTSMCPPNGRLILEKGGIASNLTFSILLISFQRMIERTIPELIT